MVFLNGHAISGDGPRGDRLVDDHFLLLFNAYDHPVDFILPRTTSQGTWRVRIDTKRSKPRKSRRRFETGDPVRVEGSAVLVLGTDLRGQSPIQPAQSATQPG
jgi:glycogen operon protein